MANPNIMLSGIVPNLTQAASEGFALGRQIKQAPLLDELNQAKLAMSQQQVQEGVEAAGGREADLVYRILGDKELNPQTFFETARTMQEMGVPIEEDDFQGDISDNMQIMESMRQSGKMSAIRSGASIKSQGGRTDFVKQVGTTMEGGVEVPLYQNFSSTFARDPSNPDGGLIAEETPFGGKFTKTTGNPVVASKIEAAGGSAFAKTSGEQAALEETSEQRAVREAAEAAAKLEAEKEVELAAKEEEYKIELANEPEIEKRMAQARIEGKARGEDKDTLANLEATLPNFENLVGRLGKLADTATYTTSGRITNAGFRELGFSVPDGADDRASYIAIANNEVLPLLRQMLGPAFTEGEGERVLALLGNPNNSPSEKQAELAAFMEAKKNQVSMLQRKLSSGDELSDEQLLDMY